jgi:hypothetical protein
MVSKIQSTIFITSILAFTLISAIPAVSVSAIIHEGLMGEDQGGNTTQTGEGGETGGMTEGQTVGQ